MIKDQITFNDLPQVIAELRDEVSGMKALLLNLQNRPTQQRENRHRPVTPEQVAEYTNIPLATIYQKLANRIQNISVKCDILQKTTWQKCDILHITKLLQYDI